MAQWPAALWHTMGRKNGLKNDIYLLSPPAQCRKVIKELGLRPHIHADTAGAAAEVAQKGNKTQAAIASRLAGELYGLDVLKEGIQDIQNNTTRFLVLSQGEMVRPKSNEGPILTSFFFEVRNVPAALYKALGDINVASITKLESYIDPQFNAARFYAEVLGILMMYLQMALEELNFFAKDVKIMRELSGSLIQKLNR